MCFYVSKNNPDAIVAKRNIRTYKLLEDVKITKRGNLIGKSPYRDYIWYKGKLVSIKEPLHRIACSHSDRYDYKIDKGLHSYTTSDVADTLLERSEVVCEFFIPKGATYYINNTKNEIVANQMIWSGRVWKNDRWGEFKIKKNK